MDFQEFRLAAIYTVHGVLSDIWDSVERDPEFSFARVDLKGKHALLVDVYAEKHFGKTLARYHGGRFSHIKLLGEERLADPHLDLTGEKGIYVLIDALDGTDLLERRLSSWCSAAIFFEPSGEPGRRILGAFVGLPNKDIYYSTSDRPGVFVRPAGRQSERPVRGTTGATSLLEASLCFYGQKLDNLRSIYESGFLDALKERIATNEGAPKSGTRIYNLAGIPMMMKMIDHRVSEAHGIDAVFDLRGQRAHDVVPGAYLVRRSGATVCHLDGRDCEDQGLEELLLRPAAPETRLRYFAAATRQLADELCSLLSSEAS